MQDVDAPGGIPDEALVNACGSEQSETFLHELRLGQEQVIDEAHGTTPQRLRRYSISARTFSGLRWRTRMSRLAEIAAPQKLQS